MEIIIVNISLDLWWKVGIHAGNEEKVQDRSALSVPQVVVSVSYVSDGKRLAMCDALGRVPQLSASWIVLWWAVWSGTTSTG